MNGLIVYLSNDRDHVASCKDTPESLQQQGGLHLSPAPLHVWRGVLIRQCWPVNNVYRLRCNHGLLRHTSPPTRSYQNLTCRRPRPHNRPVAVHNKKICGVQVSRMTSHLLLLCSERFMPLNLRTNVQNPKEVPLATINWSNNDQIISEVT
jgi:hypothetical protein